MESVTIERSALDNGEVVMPNSKALADRRLSEQTRDWVFRARHRVSYQL